MESPGSLTVARTPQNSSLLSSAFHSRQVAVLAQSTGVPRSRYTSYSYLDLTFINSVSPAIKPGESVLDVGKNKASIGVQYEAASGR